MAPPTEVEAVNIGKPVIIALILGTLTICRIVYIGLTCKIRHIPGPWYSLFTHLWLKRAVVVGQRTLYIDSLHRKYGPMVRISPYEVAVADLNGFREIHKMGTKYLKSTWYQRLVDFPRLNLFSMIEPRDHGLRKKLMSRTFSRTFLVEHWEQFVRDKVHLAVEKIRDAAMQDKADVYNWWILMASDISAHLAFGEPFGMLELGHASPFIRALSKLTVGQGIMAELPLLRLLRFIPIPSVQENFNGNDYVLKGAWRAVEIARSRTGEANIFARVVESSEKEGEGHIDDMDVRIEACDIIVAGTDTTGVTMTYLTWAVLQRPELHKALEEEVAALKEGFTENDLIPLPLLNAVIEETLRLYGAAPSSLPRVVPEGGAKLGGYYIPGNTTVSTQAYTFHRDPMIWSDPLTFNPNRWIPTPGTPAEAQSPNAKTAFHPFGAGSRSCLGIHLARMELRYAVAFFFRECRGIKLCESVTPESMEFKNFFLISPKDHRCEITLRS